MRLKAFLSGLLALLVSVSSATVHAEEESSNQSSEYVRQLMELLKTRPASEFHAGLIRRMDTAVQAGDTLGLQDAAFFVYGISLTLDGQKFLRELNGREYSLLTNRTLAILMSSQDDVVKEKAGDFVRNLMQAWFHTPERTTGDEYRKYIAMMRMAAVISDPESVANMSEVLITEAPVNPSRSIEEFNREGVAKLVAADLLSDVSQMEWEIVSVIAHRHGVTLPSIDESKLRPSEGANDDAQAALNAARVALSQTTPEPEANHNSQAHGHGHDQAARATPEMIEAEKSKLMTTLQSKSANDTLFEIRTAIRGRTSSYKRAELDSLIAAAAEVFESDAGQRFLSRLNFEQQKDLVEKMMSATRKSKLEDREQIKKRLLKSYMSAFKSARIPIGLNHYRQYLAIMQWVLRDSPSDAETLKTSDNLLGNEGSLGQSTAAFMTKGFAAIDGAAANLKLSYVERNTLRKMAKLSKVTVPASVAKKMPASRIEEIVLAVQKLGRYVKEKARSVRARFTRPAINSCEGSFSP